MSMLPFRMTVCGIQELPEHCESGVTHVLSILDPQYPVPDAFGGFGEHDRLELRFHDVIEERPGESPPQPEHVDQILALGRAVMREDPGRAHLLVHCHAGVSRSTASLLMILAQARPALSSGELTQTVLGIREKAWPNLRMTAFADRALGRDGALVRAAVAAYQYQLSVRPHLADVMTRDGRGREVEAARS
jgi:predicted protein tyrosine phosphatase